MSLNGSRASRWTSVGLVVVSLCAGLFHGAAARAGEPQVASTTLVTGAPDMYSPGTLVANLDAGAKVAGVTWWDRDGGVMNADTRVGFLWSAESGARVFSPDDMHILQGIRSPGLDQRDWYWNWNRLQPTGISDGGAVVGMHLMYTGLMPFFLPYFWTPQDGYNFLPLPCLRYGGSTPGTINASLCVGSASAISADGGTAVGQVRSDSSFTTPEKAARWRITRTASGAQFELTVLPETDPWSRAWDVSADGSVIVGEAGPEEMLQYAARWVGGRLQNLDRIGSASIARFTSRDGAAAMGWATIGDQNVLVRWDRTGAAMIATPPYGMNLESIQAINPSATAAVGALSSGGYYPDWAPFIWTLEGGFTLIPELGREQEYDASEAMDLSDDGAFVVGQVSSWVQGPGSARSQAFLWSRATGATVAINDLLAAAGDPDPNYYFAPSMSGDGLRILVKGDPARTEHDTDSLLITLTR